MPKHPNFHQCERFLDRGLPCPLQQVRPFSGLGRQDGDDDSDDDSRSPVRRRQESVSKMGLRVAAMVAFEQLIRNGMVGVPSLANGGIPALVNILANPGLQGLFGEGDLAMQGGSPEMAAFETDFATKTAVRAEELGPLSEGKGFLDGMVGDLVRAVAFGGSAMAAGAGLSAATKPPSGSGVGKHLPRSFGGGGIGFTFKQPTFRPVGARRQKPFSFSGSPPTE